MSEDPAGQENLPAAPVCWKCGNEINPDARYCRHCGATQQEDLKEGLSKKYPLIWRVAIFFAIVLVVCSIAQFSDDLQDFRDLLAFDVILIVSTVVFAILGWKHIRPALRIRGFSFARAGFYILIAAGFSIMVQYTMDWLNHNLFETEVFYYYAFADTQYPLLWMLLFIAVEPAIFEELGFRGFMQGTLNNILDKAQSLSITAFAFAVIHLNLISIIWLIPFALLLGYVRMRENNLWYGVLMHFVFNGIAVLHDLPEYYARN